MKYTNSKKTYYTETKSFIWEDSCSKTINMDACALESFGLK